nr:DUF6127 family protein [Limibaculum sp. NKW23]
MTPPRSEQGFVRVPKAEFEAIRTAAAEAGARRALADVGQRVPRRRSTSGICAPSSTTCASCAAPPCRVGAGGSRLRRASWPRRRPPSCRLSRTLSCESESRRGHVDHRRDFGSMRKFHGMSTICHCQFRPGQHGAGPAAVGISFVSAGA